MLTAVSGRYSNTVTMAYGDNDGRLEDESLTIASQTYAVGRSYDGRGMLYQLDYPDGSMAEKAYTDRGQLHTTKFRSGSGGTLYTEDTRTYDAGGRLSTMYRNGVTTTYAYRSSGGNKDNQLDSISFVSFRQRCVGQEISAGERFGAGFPCGKGVAHGAWRDVASVAR